MRRRVRSILATILVLGFASFEYLHSEYARLDLEVLNFAFDGDKGELRDIPPEIRSLDGRLVSITGYMIPMDQAAEIHAFAMVPWLFEPCPPPDIRQTVVVNSRAGLPYFPDRITVYGRLHVRVTRDDGYIVSLYEVDAERVSGSASDRVAAWPPFVIATVSAIVVILVARRVLVRRHRRRTGYCGVCGYDLRVTPLRCPECGAVPIAIAGRSRLRGSGREDLPI